MHTINMAASVRQIGDGPVKAEDSKEGRQIERERARERKREIAEEGVCLTLDPRRMQKPQKYQKRFANRSILVSCLISFVCMCVRLCVCVCVCWCVRECSSVLVCASVYVCTSGCVCVCAQDRLNRSLTCLVLYL